MPQGASLPVPIQGWGSGQTAQINFKDIAEEGPVELFKLKFLFSLLSTGAAFALSIDTGINAGSEGGDDADVLLATLLTNWVADLTQDEQTFSETGVQVRTLLGLLNTRDFAGSFMVNPVNVPVSTGSAQQYSLEINVPVALDQYVPWGGISTLGTQYLRNGFMQLSAGNLGATLAFAHGNAVLSAVTPSCEAALGVGESGDCGLRWVARRTSATLQFEPERFDMPLFFGSTSAPAASPRKRTRGRSTASKSIPCSCRTSSAGGEGRTLSFTTSATESRRSTFGAFGRASSTRWPPRRSAIRSPWSTRIARRCPICRWGYALQARSRSPACRERSGMVARPTPGGELLTGCHLE